MRLNIPVFIREKVCPMCAGHMDQHGCCVVCTGCYPLYRSLESDTRRVIKRLLPLTHKQKAEIRERWNPLLTKSPLDRFLLLRAA